MITMKSTKAEMFQAYQELSAMYAKDRAEQVVPTVTKEAAKNSLSMLWFELKALDWENYRLGVWCRKASEPFLVRAMLIVNNDRMGRSRSRYPFPSQLAGCNH